MCCCTAVVAAPAAAVRHRVPDGTNCCWFIESDCIYGFLSLHSQTRFIFNVCTYPLAVLFVFTASICLILHPRQLKACAEPRRASNHRGEASFVYTVKKNPGKDSPGKSPTPQSVRKDVAVV